MHLEDVDPREFTLTEHKFLCRKKTSFCICSLVMFAGIVTFKNQEGYECSLDWFDEVKLIVYSN